MIALRIHRPTPLRPRLLASLGFLPLALTLLFGAPSASSAQDDRAISPAKQRKFAVVSIRPSKAGGPQNFGAPTPDGYRMTNMFLAAPIMTAYVPQTGGASAYSDDQVIGMPAWTYSDDDHYDITAKVDDADLADWQTPSNQPAMLRAMLQSMLADRLKLSVHRSSKEGPVYALIIGKSGPKLKPSNPTQPHPNASPFPGGGILSMEVHEGEVTTHFYGITIGQLAVSLSADRPVQDRTGLTGTFDITLQQPTAPPPPPGTPQQAPPPEQQISPFALAEQLGLKLEPSRGQVETLVIDHIEHPSEN